MVHVDSDVLDESNANELLTGYLMKYIGVCAFSCKVSRSQVTENERDDFGKWETEEFGKLWIGKVMSVCQNTIMRGHYW